MLNDAAPKIEELTAEKGGKKFAQSTMIWKN
jgi:hypothetical protein